MTIALNGGLHLKMSQEVKGRALHIKVGMKVEPPPDNQPHQSCLWSFYIDFITPHHAP